MFNSAQEIPERGREAQFSASYKLPADPQGLAFSFLSYRQKLQTFKQAVINRPNLQAMVKNPDQQGLKKGGLCHTLVASFLQGSSEAEVIERCKKLSLDTFIYERDHQYENTPLHWCALFNYPQLARMLAKEGYASNFETPNKAGLTPLQTGVLFQHGDFVLRRLQTLPRFTELHVDLMDETIHPPHSHPLVLNEFHLAILTRDDILVQTIPRLWAEKYLPLSTEVKGVGNVLHLLVYAAHEVEARSQNTLDVTYLLDLILQQSFIKAEAFKELLKQKAGNPEDCTPLMLAAKYQHVGLLCRLVRYMQLHVEKMDGLGEIEAAFYTAAFHTQVKAVQALLALGFIPSNQHQAYDTTIAYLAKHKVKQEKRLKTQEGGQPDPRFAATLNIIKERADEDYFKHYHKPNAAQQPYTNLVLQGGGGRGFAFPFALKALQKFCTNRAEQKWNTLKQQTLSFEHIVRVAGTSAGAIFALGLAIGLSPEEMERELTYDFSLFLESEHLDKMVKGFNNKDAEVKALFTGLLEELGIQIDQCMKSAEQVRPSHHPLPRGVWELGRHGSAIYRELKKTWDKLKELNQDFNGLSSGRQVYTFLEGLMKKRGIDPTLTFGELAELVKPQSSFRHLHVVVTNFTQGKFEVLSSENPRYQDYVILDAVRASMAYPIVFAPHWLRLKYILPNREPSFSRLSDEYIDGGVLRNYAIDEFDYKRYSQTDWPGDPHFPELNKETVGICFQAREAPVGIQEPPSSRVLTSINQFWHLYSNAEDLISDYLDKLYHRSIQIDTVDPKSFSITTFSFKKLTEEEKGFLEARSYQAVSAYVSANSTSAEKVNVQAWTREQGKNQFFPEEAKSSENIIKQTLSEKKLLAPIALKKNYDQSFSPKLIEQPVKTKTELLFEEIYQLLCNHLWKVYGIEFSENKYIRVTYIYSPIFKIIENLAYKVKMERNTNLTYQYIEKETLQFKALIRDFYEKVQEYKENEFKKTFNIVDLLVRIGLLLPRQESKLWFYSINFQDFFCAKYLADSFIEQPVRIGSFIIEHKYNKNYKEVWKFMGGLLKENEECLNKFLKVLKNHSQDLIGYVDVMLFIECLNECGSKSTAKTKEAIVKIIKNWIDFLIEGSNYNTDLIFWDYLKNSKFLLENEELGEYLYSKLKEIMGQEELISNIYIEKILKIIRKTGCFQSENSGYFWDMLSRYKTKNFQVFKLTLSILSKSEELSKQLIVKELDNELKNLISEKISIRKINFMPLLYIVYYSLNNEYHQNVSYDVNYLVPAIRTFFDLYNAEDDLVNVFFSKLFLKIVKNSLFKIIEEELFKIVSNLDLEFKYPIAILIIKNICQYIDLEELKSCGEKIINTISIPIVYRQNFTKQVILQNKYLKSIDSAVINIFSESKNESLGIFNALVGYQYNNAIILEFLIDILHEKDIQLCNKAIDILSRANYKENQELLEKYLGYLTFIIIHKNEKKFQAAISGLFLLKKNGASIGSDIFEELSKVDKKFSKMVLLAISIVQYLDNFIIELLIKYLRDKDLDIKILTLSCVAELDEVNKYVKLSKEIIKLKKQSNFKLLGDHKYDMYKLRLFHAFIKVNSNSYEIITSHLPTLNEIEIFDFEINKLLLSILSKKHFDLDSKFNILNYFSNLEKHNNANNLKEELFKCLSNLCKYGDNSIILLFNKIASKINNLSLVYNLIDSMSFKTLINIYLTTRDNFYIKFIIEKIIKNNLLVYISDDNNPQILYKQKILGLNIEVNTKISGLLSLKEYLIKNFSSLNNIKLLKKEQLEHQALEENKDQAIVEVSSPSWTRKVLMKVGSFLTDQNENPLIECILKFDKDHVIEELKESINQHKLFINMKGKSGYYPMLLAIKNNQKAVVEILIQNGAKLKLDFSIGKNSYQYFYQYAQKIGNTELAYYLLQKTIETSKKIDYLISDIKILGYKNKIMEKANIAECLSIKGDDKEGAIKIYYEIIKENYLEKDILSCLYSILQLARIEAFKEDYVKAAIFLNLNLKLAQNKYLNYEDYLISEIAINEDSLVNHLSERKKNGFSKKFISNNISFLKKLREDVEKCLSDKKEVFELLGFFNTKILKMFKQMIEQCFEQIGKPPLKFKYAIVLLGSHARREALPRSDVDYMIIVENKKEQANYFVKFATLFKVKIINLGEVGTHEILRFPIQIPNNGICIDDSLNPLSEVYDLINTPEELKKLVEKQKTNADVRLYAMHSVECLHGDKSLVEKYLSLVNNVLNTDNLRVMVSTGLIQLTVEDLKERLYKELPVYKKNWVNIKKEFYRFVVNIISGLRMYFHVNYNNTYILLNELRELNKISESLRISFIEIYEFSIKMRIKAHIIYRVKNDCFYLNNINKFSLHVIDEQKDNIFNIFYDEFIQFDHGELENYIKISNIARKIKNIFSIKFEDVFNSLARIEIPVENNIREIAEFYEIAHKYSEAIHYYMLMYDYNNNDELIIIKIGYLYFVLNNFSEAINFYQKASKLISRKYGEESKQSADHQLRFAQAYFSMGNYKMAKANFEKALKTYRDKKYKTDLAITYSCIAKMYMQYGFYSLAFENLKNFFEIKKEVKNYLKPRFIVECYVDLIDVCLYMKKFDMAFSWFLDINDIMYDSDRIIYHTGLAKLQFYNSAYEEALNEITTAEKFVEKLKKSRFLNPCVISLYDLCGDIFSALGDIEQAIEKKLHAIRFAESIYGDENNPYVAELYDSIGLLYLKANDENMDNFIKEDKSIQENFDLEEKSIGLINANSISGKSFVARARCVFGFAIKLEEKHITEDNMNISKYAYHLALTYKDSLNIDEFFPYIIRALEVKEKFISIDVKENSSGLILTECFKLLCYAYNRIEEIADSTSQKITQEFEVVSDKQKHKKNFSAFNDEYDKFLSKLKIRKIYLEKQLNNYKDILDFKQNVIIYNQLGKINIFLKDYNAAIYFFNLLLELDKKILGPHSVWVSRVLKKIGYSYYLFWQDTGSEANSFHLKNAQKYYEDALYIDELLDPFSEWVKEGLGMLIRISYYTENNTKEYIGRLTRLFSEKNELPEKKLFFGTVPEKRNIPYIESPQPIKNSFGLFPERNKLINSDREIKHEQNLKETPSLRK